MYTHFALLNFFLDFLYITGVQNRHAGSLKVSVAHDLSICAICIMFYASSNLSMHKLQISDLNLTFTLARTLTLTISKSRSIFLQIAHTHKLRATVLIRANYYTQLPITVSQ